MRSVLLCLVSACASQPPPDKVDCTKVTGTDTFVVGLEKMGVGGQLDFKLMSADPAPPARGNNTWIVQVNAMSGGTVGQPLTGASMIVSPYMPAHGHGPGVDPEITAMSTPGQYKIDPVNLWMPGVWETTITASGTGGSDNAMYRFCIPE